MLKLLPLILALSTNASALSYTSHFNLAKPTTGDTNYVTPFNVGMDTIDTQLYGLQVATSTLLLPLTGGTLTGPLTLAGSSLTVTGSAFSVGTSTFVVTGGKVGVGYNTPSAILDVVGKFALGGGGPLNSGTETSGLLRITGNRPDYGEVMDMGVKVGSYAWIQSTNWASLAVSNPLILNPNGGSVGIGTTSPQSKVDISSGTIRMAGTGAPTTGGALCLNSVGAMAKCTSAVDASGNCTCP